MKKIILAAVAVLLVLTGCTGPTAADRANENLSTG